MARISSYQYDSTVTDNDAWIGTESLKRNTKQFTAQAVSDYLNLNAKINIGGQMSFTWDDVEKGGTGTISKVGGSGSGGAFNSLTQVFLSKNEVNNQNVVKFLEYIIGKDILLGQGDQISQFGHYTLDSYVVDTDTDYYKATLTYLGGNGTIINSQKYTLIHFDISDSDDTFIFTQGVPATTWTITHNLNKFPSVSVVDTANNGGFGDVTYNSANQLTVIFSGAFAGKAYLN